MHQIQYRKKSIVLIAISAVLSSFTAIDANAQGAQGAQGVQGSSNLQQSAATSIQPAPTTTQADRTISLKASFDQAVSVNKDLLAAQYSVDFARAAIRTAGAIPNPHFNLQYGWGPAFTLILAGNPQQFGWQEEIKTAGKISKQVNLARSNYKQSELQLAAHMFDLHNRVRRAYAELAAAEAYADLIESERNVAAELQGTTEKRFESGKGPKSEALQAELGVLQFDTQRNQARTRLQVASSALTLLIGETPARVEIIDVDDNGIFKISAQHTDLVPPPERSVPALEDLLPVSESSRFDLKAAIQQRYADRKALTLAKAQRIPDLFIDSGYQFTTFKKTQPDNLFPGRVPTSSGCYLNVGMELPIFYQHQGEVAQARETWLQDFDQVKQLEYQIATDVVTSYESVAVARANISKFQHQLIPQAAQVARLARRSYEVGKKDLASAILAKQQYQQILSSYFDAVVAYQNAWADLEKAIGVPLTL